SRSAWSRWARARSRRSSSGRSSAARGDPASITEAGAVAEPGELQAGGVRGAGMVVVAEGLADGRSSAGLPLAIRVRTAVLFVGADAAERHGPRLAAVGQTAEGPAIGIAPINEVAGGAGAAPRAEKAASGQAKALRWI